MTAPTNSPAPDGALPDTRTPMADESRPTTAPPPPAPTPRAPRTVAPPKPTAEIVAATLVDLAVVGIFGKALLDGKITDPWLQGVCLVGLLLLAGVRVADIVAGARGLPTRGGPAAIFLAGALSLADRFGGGGVS